MAFDELLKSFNPNIVVSSAMISFLLLSGYVIGRIGEELVKIKKRDILGKWNKIINPKNKYFEEFASLNNLREVLQVRDIGFCKDEYRSCEDLYSKILKRQVFSIRIIRENQKSGVGYFAVIGVKKKTYIDYVNGRIDDSDLLYKNRIPIIKSIKGYNNKYLYLFSISNNKIGNYIFGLEILKRYISYIQKIVIHARINGLFMLVVNRGLSAILRRKFSDLIFINIIKGKHTFNLPIANIEKVIIRINEISEL